MLSQVGKLLRMLRHQAGFAVTSFGAALALALMTTPTYLVLGNTWWWIPILTVWAFLIAVPEDEPLEHAALFALIVALGGTITLYVATHQESQHWWTLLLWFLLLGVYAGAASGVFLREAVLPARRDFDQVKAWSWWAALVGGGVVALASTPKAGAAARDPINLLSSLVGVLFLSGVWIGAWLGRRIRRVLRHLLGLSPDDRIS